MSALAGRRILVVEDEFVIAALAADLLEGLGASVVGPAGTLEAALELAATEDLHAAVLDVNMNGLRSDPVAELLAGRGVPFVFATGYGGGWPGAAAAPVVEKPYTAERLAEALRLAISAGPGQEFREAP